MQMVINIPKVMFINAKRDLLFGADILVDAIKNGTPLPKGHGRLIDADALECDCFNRTSDDYAFDCIDNAPTIIEADRAESEG